MPGGETWPLTWSIAWSETSEDDDDDGTDWRGTAAAGPEGLHCFDSHISVAVVSWQVFVFEVVAELVVVVAGVAVVDLWVIARSKEVSWLEDLPMGGGG